MRFQLDPAGWQSTLKSVLSSNRHVGNRFGSWRRLNQVAIDRDVEIDLNVEGDFPDCKTSTTRELLHRSPPDWEA